MKVLKIPAILGLLLLPTLLNAQFIQQGNKLVGTGSVGFVHQGSAVSISADGNTAVVGGPYDNSPDDIANVDGAVWVFTRSGGVWFQQGRKLVGTGAIGGAGQGAAVAISADGTTVVVGGPLDNCTGGINDPGGVSCVGAVWIFTRNGEVWSQQGSKLVGAGAAGGARQGTSVAISSDGNTAIVGGPADLESTGAAWIFTRNGGAWSQQGSKLLGSGAAGGFGARQGSSVSISANGNTALVGGPGDNGSAGAGWVFARVDGAWYQQGDKLVGTGAAGGGEAGQGYSVAISGDGNSAILGGPGDGCKMVGRELFACAGAAWVFTRSGDVWSQQGNKLVGTGADPGAQAPGQGSSVAISADGDTAIVGSVNDSSPFLTYATGAAWAFTRSQGTWAQQGRKLVGAGAVGYAAQGASVAISGDGTTAIVGGPADVGGPGNTLPLGAAWIFERVPVGGPCTSSSTSLCLGSGRFEVNVEWFNQHGSSPTSGLGSAIPDTAQTGFFSFFSPESYELAVKIIDGTAVNGNFWVFYGALSDVEYTITVTDRQTGAFKTYHNDPGNICGGADTEAFPGTASSSVAGLPPAISPAAIDSTGLFPANQLEPAVSPGTLTPCTPDATSLCLLSGRFRVSVAWVNQHPPGGSGAGTAIPATDQSGEFWFFSPQSVELVVKMVDGAAVNGKFWVFYGALSDVEYTITVTDTQTGIVKTYHNDPGNICGGADTSAFASTL